MDYYKELGMKIRGVRKEKGYTQETLGKELNVVKATISAWELGKNKINCDDLQRLNTLLNTDFTIEKREKQNMKIKELNKIEDVNEFEEILSTIISEQNLETSHPKSLSKMLYNFLYLVIGYNIFFKVQNSIRELRIHPKWKVYEPSWFDIGQELRDFLSTESIPTKDYDFYKILQNEVYNQMALKIYLMAYGIGGERFESEIKCTNFAYKIGDEAENKGYELFNLIPNSSEENELINEFRFAIINLSDYLIDL